LLNLAGEQAIETYNTFTYTEGESEEDIDVVIKKVEEHCNPKRTLHMNDMYLIHKVKVQ
jgi:hypothetical protein